MRYAQKDSGERGQDWEEAIRRGRNSEEQCLFAIKIVLGGLSIRHWGNFKVRAVNITPRVKRLRKLDEVGKVDILVEFFFNNKLSYAPFQVKSSAFGVAEFYEKNPGTGICVIDMSKSLGFVFDKIEAYLERIIRDPINFHQLIDSCRLKKHKDVLDIRPQRIGWRRLKESLRVADAEEEMLCAVYDSDLSELCPLQEEIGRLESHLSLTQEEARSSNRMGGMTNPAIQQ